MAFYLKIYCQKYNQVVLFLVDLLFLHKNTKND